MAELDTVSKHLIQTYPADFVRFTIQRDDIEVVEVLDTEQPTVETRRTDSLIRVRIGGKDALVHHEFQTTDSTRPPMPRRMAGYIGRCIERYGLPVYAYVFYLRPAAGRRDPGCYLQALCGHQIFVQYKVIRLSQQAGQAVLDRKLAGLLPLAPLMQPPAGQTPKAWLDQCVATAAAVPLERSIKANFLAGLAILSGLVYNPQTITAIVSKEHLMDLIHESSFAQYLAESAREQGIEQCLRFSIQEALAVRFDPGAAQSFAAGLEAIGDVQRLKQLHRAAIQVSSLEAFRHLVEADE